MFNCAIIGCGNIAAFYDTPEDQNIRTHIKAYLSNDKCNLTAICDTKEKKLKEIQNTWGSFNIYLDSNDLLENVQIDILSICTPTETHEEIFNKACETGVKKIWLEKPSSINAASIRRMIDKKNTHGTAVYVNYFRRYDLGFIKVKEEIEKIGSVVDVRGYYTKGLRHNGSHVIDLLQWLFGQSKQARLTSKFDKSQFPTASFELEFDEVLAQIQGIDYRNFELFELDIIGSRGRIKILEGGRFIKFYSVTESSEYVGYSNLKLNLIHRDTINLFMTQGLKNVLNNDPMPTLEEDLNTQKIIDSLEII